LPLRVEVAADCAWARPIRLAEATTTWLRELYDEAGAPLPGTPATLHADLEQVARHNDKHAAICG